MTALRALSFPGVEVPAGFAPWILYPEAAAVAAQARYGTRSEAHSLHDDLVTKGLALISGERGFLDYPVTGAILYALALWELTDDRDPDQWRRAVRLLVLADAFAYNRMLPSLGWPYAEAVAEKRCPGLVAAVRAELGGRRPVELREEACHLVAELA